MFKKNDHPVERDLRVLAAVVLLGLVFAAADALGRVRSRFTDSGRNLPSLQEFRILNVSSTQELQLIAQASRGDRAALESLVAEHEAAVFRYALSLVQRREDAEEVLREVFLAFLRYANAFRGEASLRTWLLTVTRNTAFRVRKKATDGEGAPVELDALGAAAGWGSEDPEALAIRAQSREALERALNGLSEEDREIVLLRDLEGLSGEETAAMLGITVAAMKSRLHRARLRLAGTLRSGGAK